MRISIQIRNAKSLLIPVHCVGVDEPGGREGDGAEVTDGDAKQDGVGGWGHLLPGQDANDQDVGDAGDDHQDWHDVAIHWLDKLDWAKEGACIDHITWLWEHATRNESSAWIN